MKIIRLRRTKQGWLATYVGDEGLKKLFGTATLPTIFTAFAEEKEVVTKISELNPGYQLEVEK